MITVAYRELATLGVDMDYKLMILLDLILLCLIYIPVRQARFATNDKPVQWLVLAAFNISWLTCIFSIQSLLKTEQVLLWNQLVFVFLLLVAVAFHVLKPAKERSC
jgi:hypothetical protein